MNMGYLKLFLFVIVVTEALQKGDKRLKKPHTKKCVIKPMCDPHYKYRTADGSCNNLKRKSWGQSNTKQRRFLRPDYEDGHQSPRELGHDNIPLPSTRVVSNKVHQNIRAKTKKDRKLNVLHMSFGQFLSHDIILTPASDKTDCCGTNKDDPQCMQIPVPRRDPFFTTRCMPLTRSDPFSARHKHLRHRRQINKVTSYVDASNVYGSTEKKARELRSLMNGKMRQIDDGLPAGGSNCIFDDMDNDYCQDAGDGRQNVVPNLGSVHLLFIRYHNYVAEELKKLNSHWDDEKLYQETRAIISGIMQHVVYNEYLPHVLGQTIMEEFNLFSKSRGFDDVYDKTIDASTRNVVGTAAMRFGHSQISNVQKDFSKAYKETESRKIEATFHHPHMCVRRNGRGNDGVLRWQLAERTAKVDGHIKSIDVYAGGITEVPVPGGIVGPTFACLLARQFYLYKRGDRFWYENNFPKTGFTEDQLNEIKKVTLSSIICESMDVDRVTRDAFRVRSKRNKRVKCSDLPKPSWLPWEE